MIFKYIGRVQRPKFLHFQTPLSGIKGFEFYAINLMFLCEYPGVATRYN